MLNIIVETVISLILVREQVKKEKGLFYTWKTSGAVSLVEVCSNVLSREAKVKFKYILEHLLMK